MAATGPPQPLRGQPGVAAVLEYLEARATEPCGRTVPQGVLDALKFIESAGGVPDADKVSSSPLRAP